MLRLLDSWLDRITMYRLLLYYLIALVLAAAGLSVLGKLHFSPIGIVFEAAYAVAVCWFSNTLFVQVWRAPVNRESAWLTGLILALIITPPTTPFGVVFLTAACGLAMASKYVLSIRHQHIFNPAAIAVVLTALGAKQAASWWVGSAPMLAFVLIGGLLLMRKLRRGQMVTTFIITTLLATAFYAALLRQGIITTLHNTLLSSALFFLAFVMLTEPQTSPATLDHQRWYAVLAGVLFPPQVHLGSFYSTPELTLVVSNIFAYVVSPRVKLTPSLREKQRLTPDTFDFVFVPNRSFDYLPGQYMEWTLPHGHADSRGERRYFTLASSPTEPTVRLGIKFYKDGSSYKRAMLSMGRHTPIAAGQLSGDFVMPRNQSKKLAFIAGGIGITPFRSMIKYLLDTDDSRLVTLLYAATSSRDFVYTDILEAARKQLGINTIYVTSRPETLPNSPHFRSGKIDTSLLQREIPDYLERTFYISGPHGMVTAVQDVLTSLGVPHHQIKIDFFPGYA